MPNDLFDAFDGAPNQESYTDNGDGTVTDNITKLMWQQILTPAPDAGNNRVGFDWAGASTYCNTTLNAASPLLGGHNDWRLPTAIELISLFDLGQQAPLINPTYFPMTTAMNVFWSSTPVVGSTTTMWGVGFLLGGQGQYPTTDFNYVRCVR
jgi:hypothetical protein